MQYAEAILLINGKGGSKYTGKRLMLLTYLVKSFNNKNFKQNIDIEGRIIKRKVSTLQLRLGVKSDDQLRRIIRAVDEVEQVKWVNGMLLLKLKDLDNLKTLEDTRELIERRNEVVGNAHAAKERERRAAIRERERVAEMQRLLGDAPMSSFTKSVVLGTLQPRKVVTVQEVKPTQQVSHA